MSFVDLAHAVECDWLVGWSGLVPTCLQEDEDSEEAPIIPSVEGTYLRRSREDQRGTCDDTPPVCSIQEGCRVIVPDFWTSLHQIKFGFTNFYDPESSVEKYYFVLTEDTGDVAVPETLVDEEQPNMRITKQEIQKKKVRI